MQRPDLSERGVLRLRLLHLICEEEGIHSDDCWPPAQEHSNGCSMVVTCSAELAATATGTALFTGAPITRPPPSPPFKAAAPTRMTRLPWQRSASVPMVTDRPMSQSFPMLMVAVLAMPITCAETMGEGVPLTAIDSHLRELALDKTGCGRCMDEDEKGDVTVIDPSRPWLITAASCIEAAETFSLSSCNLLSSFVIGRAPDASSMRVTESVDGG
ncbi:hypothetical protein CAPTEDRAFT_185914 [Capitella teleta]|uniref:Uncharacterized protein n=1 Tax=Capitella teleta TaxID=283909 RepID=R7TDA1_CAPTE|nr:hypothetical protein CAPTEDRAFT_185914 [Capitella teleta]|eukprot:ELT91713.1 hypothetical protein CAPTEDRAFT_185914 [Capitella teleta]